METRLTMNDIKVLSALDNREMYGLEIVDFLYEEARVKISLGGLYNVLARLERNGLVISRWGESLANRGGNRRKYYKLTGKGEFTLNNVKSEFEMLWQNI